MADSCGSSGSGATASSNPNVISYADCPEASCDCVTLTGGVRAATSPVTVNAAFAIGPGASIEILDAPTWATAAIVGTDLLVTGTAPIGTATLVYEVRNECSQECLVLKITVAGECVPPVNIIKNIGYTNDTFVVETELAIPANSTLVSGNVPGGRYSVFAEDLTISAVLVQPFPTSYVINMTTPCGPYTISGSIIECKTPRLDRVTGTSVFEIGVPYAVSWIVEATGTMTITAQENVPSDGVLIVLQNTPSVGFATVTLTGTPTQNPGAADLKFTLRGQCGSIPLGRKYTQQKCRALLVIGETGNNQFVFDGLTPVNFCKIVRGYEPTIADFTGLPLGLQLSITPAAVAGDWLVCVTGIPRVDPCAEPDEETKKICECIEVKLNNECGDVTIKVCYNLDLASFVPKPSYCIGVYDYDPITRVFRVWGVVPLSTVTVYMATNGNIPTFAVVTDATGFAQVTLDPAFSPNNFPGVCLRATHPTCALVKKADVDVYCPPGGPGVGVSGVVVGVGN
jgi:hypothetical protein